MAWEQSRKYRSRHGDGEKETDRQLVRQERERNRQTVSETGERETGGGQRESVG